MQRAADGQVREAVMSATRALVGVAARSLAPLSDDVSLPQYRVLVLLNSRGSLNMGQLAEALDVHPSTVTRMCDVLVAKGLIRRVTAPQNRRTVRADLTAGGRKLISQVMRRRSRLLDDALARMTPEAQCRLARSMAELAEALGEASDHAWALGWGSEADLDVTP